MMLLLSCSILSAASESRGPSGCPPGVDATKWVCLTREEAQGIKLKGLDAQDQIIDLREQVAKLRVAAPTGIARFARLWATVGMEYLPNDQTYTPYALGGLTVGQR